MPPRSMGLPQSRDDARRARVERPVSRPIRDPAVFGSAARHHGHPEANLFRKQLKSSTFRMGGAVDPSQLAHGSPAAKRLRKQPKSLTLRIGGVWPPSQLA